MSNLIRHITVDSADAWRLAEFWSKVSGYPIAEGDAPGDEEVLLEAPAGAGPGLLFVTVPDAKSVKNRVHLDLEPQERSRDEEVERLLGLGATVFADHRRPDGTGWVTMADPEGNEFCVERGAAERATA